MAEAAKLKVVADNERDKVQSVEDLHSEYLLCRDFGHAWAPENVTFTGRGRSREIHRTLKCRVCPTRRLQILDADGYRVRSRYEYPEDVDKNAAPYKLRGVGHLSVDDRARIRVMDSEQIKASGG